MKLPFILADNNFFNHSTRSTAPPQAHSFKDFKPVLFSPLYNRSWDVCFFEWWAERKKTAGWGREEPDGQTCPLDVLLPFVDSASFIPQSNSHSTVFIQVKLFTVQVIIRSHPSDPHAGGVLSGKDADCIVALLGRDHRWEWVTPVGGNGLTR